MLSLVALWLLIGTSFFLFSFKQRRQQPNTHVELCGNLVKCPLLFYFCVLSSSFARRAALIPASLPPTITRWLMMIAPKLDPLHKAAPTIVRVNAQETD